MAIGNDPELAEHLAQVSANLALSRYFPASSEDRLKYLQGPAFAPNPDEPQEVLGDLGYSPANLALVPRLGNLSQFLRLMSKAAREKPLRHMDETRLEGISTKLADAYLKARYPKYADQVKAYVMDPKLYPDFWGAYFSKDFNEAGHLWQKLLDFYGSPKAGVIERGLKSRSRSGSFTEPFAAVSRAGQSEESLVDILAHEFKHARQDVKGKLPKTNELMKMSKEERFAAPHEVEARRAGATAATGFNKLVNLLEQKYGKDAIEKIFTTIGMID